MTDLVENCGCCHFCRDQDVTFGGESGACKRYPPAVVFDDITETCITAPYPFVDLDDWCGEFKRAKETVQ